MSPRARRRLVDLPHDESMRYRVRALIGRHRYMQNTLNAELQSMLRDVHRRAATEILSGALSEASRGRVQALGASAQSILAAGYPETQQRMLQRLGRYAAVEREAALLQTFGAASGLTPELAVELAALPEMVLDIGIHGQGFGEWWLHAQQGAIDRLRRELQYGLAKGDHPDVIARRIYTAKVGPKGQTGGEVWKASRQSLTVAVRSITTGIQSRAFLAAVDTGGGVRWLMLDVVRDLRTSLICIALAKAAKVYKSTDPRLPIPPFHLGCRTGFKEVPNQFGDPHEEPYDDYLARLSKDEQNDLLGKTRAELWRDAKLDLAELIDSDRRPLPLEDLRALLGDF